MSFPRPTPDAKAFFANVLPLNPHIQVRPMFGNLAGFINGNMFTGLFGGQIFIRLPEPERRELLEVEGASEFAPMPGRAMKEYVALPECWKQDPDRVSIWMQRSLEWAESLPVKLPSKKKTSKN